MARAPYKRTAHRWRLLGLMLLAVFCAFGSFWLVQVMEGQADDARVNLNNDPDYIVDNFSFVRMSVDGKPRYVISGERLTHRPADNSSEIEKPVVQSLAVDKPPMTTTANHALVDQNQNRIELTGNVDIRRPASGTSQALHIRTEAMTILTDDEIARTDKPVQMTLGSATIDAVGATVNNATQQARFGQGRATYPPRQAR
ncbi:LPS export ABC transporter periplasmic protein LptC [uncultured Massilia sp.]|uniref:LPS export ABC transporter periplasmic protein LptC n=1 Tax=uncultured Massilia sp. TaxID=169973 RepID=UPI0025F993C5|nr:LPS export ABC transporter periplasmic protein LptC [uncultured Massilia sp.]